MKFDGATIGTIFGFLGVIVTTIGGVFIATRTNKTEKVSAAQKALEVTRDEAYEQRILLRDDTIKQLKEDLDNNKTDSKLRIEELESEIDKKNLEIAELKKELQETKVDHRLRIEELESEIDKKTNEVDDLKVQLKIEKLRGAE